MITYHQLRTFVTVARTGSPTRAARELRASQPTVSLALNALRKFLGAPLLERDGALFRLTPVGEKLRRYAEETLGGLRILQQDAATFTGRVAGPLALGATFTVSRYILPSPLYRFREQFPDVKLQVYLDAPPQHLFSALFANTLDLACYVNVRTPTALTIEPIGNEQLVIVASPRHPLAGRRRVSPQELSAHPFIASGVQDFRDMADERLRDVGVTPLVAGEGQHQDAVRRLVEENAGYSLLIRSAVAEQLANSTLVMLKLDGAPFLTDVVVAYRSRSVIPPLVRQFTAFVRAELAHGRPADTGQHSRRRPRAAPIGHRRRRRR